MNALLGVLVAALLSQLAGGEHQPFVVPDTMPGLDVCSQMWQELTGDCNPCETTAALLHRLGAGPPFACPE